MWVLNSGYTNPGWFRLSTHQVVGSRSDPAHHPVVSVNVFRLEYSMYGRWL